MTLSLPIEQKGSVLSTRLPWDLFSNWVYAVCVVTFDLELGQAIESVYPEYRQLTERERSSICYLAFPDSNSGLMGNVQFHFRIRQSSCKKLDAVIRNYNQSCAPVVQVDHGYLYGYVYFRQVKDKTLKRGYLQKSLVLLSKLPLVTFFTAVLDIIAPEYFHIGEASLEAACYSISQWPLPVPGQTLTLPLLGSLVQFRIPNNSDKTGSTNLQSPTVIQELSSQSVIFIPSPHECEAFAVLAPILPHLNLLWELILTTEPLVVMASSPTTAANTIQTLISLIAPLKFCSDFRPFFTIHDSEFKEYTTKTTSPPNVVLGVTNPFFSKTLQHWPHIVRVDDGSGIQVRSQKGHLRKGLSSKGEYSPGVYTKMRPLLNADKGLVKRLLKGAQIGRPVEVQSALIRRHMLELTQSFMIPLERYIASLMPLLKNIEPFKAVPQLQPFNPDDFIATLEQSGPQLTSGIKGDWEGLYRKFFRSVNFSSWFNARHLEASNKLAVHHMEALSNVNLKAWINNRGEVELVDMVLRIKSKIKAAPDLNVSPDVIAKLNSQLQYIMGNLPDDLRSVLGIS